jgi:hypothetical protein
LVDAQKNKLGMSLRLASFALEEILETLFLFPNPGEKGKTRKNVSKNNDPGAERANCRHHASAISGQPVHPAILEVAVTAANAILPQPRNRARAPALARFAKGKDSSTSTSTITRLRGCAGCLPFRPANAPWPRVDLPTWSCNNGAKSANEVAQIINQKNNSLKEGASKQFGAKQNAKSY